MVVFKEQVHWAKLQRSQQSIMPCRSVFIVFSAEGLRMLQNAERDAALNALSETAKGIALRVNRELVSAESHSRCLQYHHRWRAKTSLGMNWRAACARCPNLPRRP